MQGEVVHAEPKGLTVREGPSDRSGIFFWYDDPAIKNISIISHRRHVGDSISQHELTMWDVGPGTLIRHLPSGGTWKPVYMKLSGTGNWVREDGLVTKPGLMPGGNYVVVTVFDRSGAKVPDGQ